MILCDGSLRGVTGSDRMRRCKGRGCRMSVACAASALYNAGPQSER